MSERTMPMGRKGSASNRVASARETGEKKNKKKTISDQALLVWYFLDCRAKQSNRRLVFGFFNALCCRALTLSIVGKAGSIVVQLLWMTFAFV